MSLNTVGTCDITLQPLLYLPSPALVNLPRAFDHALTLHDAFHLAYTFVLPRSSPGGSISGSPAATPGAPSPDVFGARDPRFRVVCALTHATHFVSALARKDCQAVLAGLVAAEVSLCCCT